MMNFLSRVTLPFIPLCAYAMDERDTTRTEGATTVINTDRHEGFHNYRRVSADVVQQGTGNAARDLYNGKSPARLLYIV
jgi:hypothetical protein